MCMLWIPFDLSANHPPPPPPPPRSSITVRSGALLFASAHHSSTLLCFDFLSEQAPVCLDSSSSLLIVSLVLDLSLRATHHVNP